MEKFLKFPLSIIHLQPISRDLGINLTAPCVDATAQTEGLMKPVPAKPSDLVKHMPAAVIVQKNFRRRISGKNRLLEFLCEKFRWVNPHRLMLLPRADIDEPEAVQFRLRFDRLGQHLKIMPMAVEQMGQHLPRI